MERGGLKTGSQGITWLLLDTPITERAASAATESSFPVHDSRSHVTNHCIWLVLILLALLDKAAAISSCQVQ
jgi:hypothetical protein